VLTMGNGQHKSRFWRKGVCFWHAGCKGSGYLSDPPVRILPDAAIELLYPIMMIAAVKAATALE
jgi:hypothetical protein